MSIEELLADESFVNYCRKSNEQDVQKWELFILQNPDRLSSITEAKAIFEELFQALSNTDLEEQEKRLLNRINLNPVGAPIPLIIAEPVISGKKATRHWWKWAVAALLVLSSGFYFLKGSNRKDATDDGLKFFFTANGERKNFQLPDGSLITLNAGSKLKICKDYGRDCRDIYLEGEAFFDVKHDKALAFVVHTPELDVKALGTAFNVKAYPGDGLAEASLIRGLVEVTLKEENNRKLLLQPEQKISWKKKATIAALEGSSNNKPERNYLDSSKLVHKVSKTDEGEVKEISWTENKLIFEDEPLEEVAKHLERWYGVEVIFEDNEIRSYRFTATFEKEELKTVLAVLKESKRFNYVIETGKVINVRLSK
jgi:ferric-dicitrate binding protein FerR (iron transport regulator)